MATYDYLPRQFDTVDLTAAPFDTAGGGFVVFDPQGDGPGKQAGTNPVEASVIGKGDSDVRAQPRGAYWDLLVGLSTTDETNGMAAMSRCFSTQRAGSGLVYLRVDDGDGTQWRVACRVTDVTRLAAALFRVRLRVPNPVLEAVTGASASDLNSAVNGALTRNITPGGSRRTALSLVYNSDTVKTRDPAYDFMYAYRGFIVNRSPEAWNDLPVDLTDTNATQPGLTTLGHIKDTSRTNLINGAISDVQTTIVVDTPGGGGVRTGAGFAWCQNEQFYYAAFDGTTFSGCVRGIGGTVNSAHADNQTVYGSNMLASMDDLRVFIDQIESDRWIGSDATGVGSAAARIWAPVTMGPRIKLTLKAAMTAGSPADGGVIDFVEDISSLPDSGIINIDRELISYTSKDLSTRRIGGIKRGIWYQDGVAATHAINSLCYLVAHLFVVAWGRRCQTGDGAAGSWPAGSTAIGAPPQPAEREPAFDYYVSTNSTWDYRRKAAGVQGETNSVFYDPANPRRLAMWLPNYDVPAADQNNAPSLRVASMADDLIWEDTDVDVGKPGIPRFTLHLPQGVKAAAGGITYDVQERRNARARILARDTTGVEVELLDQHSITDALLTGQSLTPAAILNEVTLSVCRSYVTGGQVNNSFGPLAMTNASTGWWTLLELDQETEIIAVHAKLDQDGGNVNALCEIRDNSGAYPDLGLVRATFPVVVVSAAAATWTEFLRTSYAPFVLPAGTYWLGIRVPSGANTLNWTAGNISTKNNLLYSSLLSAYNGLYAPAYFIIHRHGGPIQSHMDVLNESLQVTFSPGDNRSVAIVANTAAADPYWPKVDRSVNVETNIHHAQFQITNPATGNGTGYTVAAWMSIGASSAVRLNVDAENKLCSLYELNGVNVWAWYIPGVVAPLDASRWLDLEPGVLNAIAITEYKRTSVDHVWSYRERRV